MEQIYKGTIPGIAYSQFEYKWDLEWFIKFLKEFENEIDKIPSIFWDGMAQRLTKANKALVAIQEEFPGTVDLLNRIKEKNKKKELS